jgi:hypothetical protein
MNVQLGPRGKPEENRPEDRRRKAVRQPQPRWFPVQLDASSAASRAPSPAGNGPPSPAGTGKERRSRRVARFPRRTVEIPGGRYTATVSPGAGGLHNGQCRTDTLSSRRLEWALARRPSLAGSCESCVWCQRASSVRFLATRTPAQWHVGCSTRVAISVAFFSRGLCVPMARTACTASGLPMPFGAQGRVDAALSDTSFRLVARQRMTHLRHLVSRRAERSCSDTCRCSL